jgi:hypothetical protein
VADRGAPEDSDTAGKSPVLVRVTIEPGPRRRVAPVPTGRLGRNRRLIALAVIVLFAATIVGVVATRGTGTRAPPLRAPVAEASTPGPVGVAAAYRYPRACLSVTIAATDPAYAAVRLNRVSPCWRYGVYVTAVFHRVDGVWRMVLDTTGAGCPMSAIPTTVRAQLGLCDGESAAAAPIVSIHLLRGATPLPVQLLGRRRAS